MYPFTQSDLSPSNVYVLDAFFELYIIVGARSHTQFSAFQIALEFAQDYAILAAGMEDRPFVPISTVVLEGIPRDLKSCFRKWRDAASPTVMNPMVRDSVMTMASGTSGFSGVSTSSSSSNVRRGRSLRIVPLTHALQALREQ